VARTLIEVRVQGLEDLRVSEEIDLGLLALEVCQRQVERESLGRTWLTHDDEGRVRHRAHNGCEKVLLESLSLSNAVGEVNALDVPVQLFTKRPCEALLVRGHLVVDGLAIALPVLGIQTEIVDEAQGNHQGPKAVIPIFPTRLVLQVHLVEPLVEGENTLDVPLTHAAARTLGSFAVRKPAILELFVGVFPHQVLALQDEVGKVGLLRGSGAVTRHPHLGGDVVSFLLLSQSPIVPHEALERGVELPHVIGSSDPSLFLQHSGQAVTTVRVAGTNHKDVVRDGLVKIK